MGIVRLIINRDNPKHCCSGCSSHKSWYGEFQPFEHPIPTLSYEINPETVC